MLVGADDSGIDGDMVSHQCIGDDGFDTLRYSTQRLFSAQSISVNGVLRGAMRQSRKPPALMVWIRVSNFCPSLLP